MNNHLLNQSIYEAERFTLLKNVEESGQVELRPYVDSVGIATIGVGFNLKDSAVFNEVIKGLGLNPNSTNAADLQAINNIKTIITNTSSSTMKLGVRSFYAV